MNFYDRTQAGNDVDPGVLDTVIKKLNDIKKSVKKFSNKEESKFSYPEPRCETIKTVFLIINYINTF